MRETDRRGDDARVEPGINRGPVSDDPSTVVSAAVPIAGVPRPIVRTLTRYLELEPEASPYLTSAGVMTVALLRWLVRSPV